ncbi:MAG: hypothetical protein ABIF40_05520 [archaeon]
MKGKLFIISLITILMLCSIGSASLFESNRNLVTTFAAMGQNFQQNQQGALQRQQRTPNPQMQQQPLSNIQDLPSMDRVSQRYSNLDLLILELTENPDELISGYNEQVETLPGPVKYLIKNQKANIYVDNEYMLTVEFEKEFLNYIGTEPSEKPTLNIFTTSETLEGIFYGEIDLFQALEEELIIYEPLTFGAKMKFGMGNVVLKVAEMFN